MLRCLWLDNRAAIESVINDSAISLEEFCWESSHVLPYRCSILKFHYIFNKTKSFNAMCNGFYRLCGYGKYLDSVLKKYRGFSKCLQNKILKRGGKYWCFIEKKLISVIHSIQNNLFYFIYYYKIV